MTVEDIKETIQDYINASQMAKEAGFDGVEIHGAYGYLLDTFLQSSTNHRTDAYGGSMENRARFSEEIIQGIIDSGAFPANRIGYRMSPNGNMEILAVMITTSCSLTSQSVCPDMDLPTCMLLMGWQDIMVSAPS